MSDSYRPPPRRAIGWVERSLGAVRVLHTAQLIGGLTSDVDRLTVRTRTGGTVAVVLRRWRADNAWATGLIRRESAGLAVASRHDLPAPRLLAFDAAGEDVGVPSLLMTALPGEPLLRPADFVRRLAVTLARIHDVADPDLHPSDPHGFVPDIDRSWLGDPGLARSLAETATGPAEMSTLIHGDYQPLNVLWSGQEISGVVDWAYAGLGAPATDVGRCRLALAVLYSTDTAEEFLRCYEAEAGRAIDPRLDIRALLAFNPDWRDYVQRAVAGRAHVDAGMAGRVTELLRAAAARLN